MKPILNFSHLWVHISREFSNEPEISSMSCMCLIVGWQDKFVRYGDRDITLDGFHVEDWHGMTSQGITSPKKCNSNAKPHSVKSTMYLVLCVLHIVLCTIYRRSCKMHRFQGVVKLMRATIGVVYIGGQFGLIPFPLSCTTLQHCELVVKAADHVA